MNWQKCVRCNIYFDQPNYLATASLCPDCWKFLPHYKTVSNQKVSKGPTHKLPHILKDITFPEILMYIIGNGLCLLIIVYYLWFK